MNAQGVLKCSLKVSQKECLTAQLTHVIFIFSHLGFGEEENRNSPIHTLTMIVSITLFTDISMESFAKSHLNEEKGRTAKKKNGDRGLEHTASDPDVHMQMV